MCPEVQCLQRPQKGTDSPGLKVRTCKSLNVGAGNELWTSARIESTLNPQDFSPAQKFLQLFQIKVFEYFRKLNED